jgi:amino acid permease
MVGTLPILVLASVSAILALVALFSFKNREMQIKMNSYNIFITVIFIVTIYLYLPYNIQKALPVADYQWQYGLVFPLISLAFLILANVFIKKDEKLVKSADRLR